MFNCELFLKYIYLLEKNEVVNKKVSYTVIPPMNRLLHMVCGGLLWQL